MTDKVIPSVQGDSDAYIVAKLIEKGSRTAGWIQESSTSLLADNHSSISGAPLNAFGESHSSSSFDVTIDTGEGFVGGAWVARDTTTTVTLSSSTNNQTVYLGWDHDGTDVVRINTDPTDSSTSWSWNSEDPRISIWEFDTDGSGVTNATDKRQIGQSSDLGEVTLSDSSEFGRWLSVAIGSSPFGTEGNSNNEIFRAIGTSSDLVMSVQDGSGKMNIAYNAYYDGTNWNYIVGGEGAMRLEFSDGVKLHSAPSGTADNTITWDTFQYDESTGDILANGTKLYDDGNSQVPKSQLGGPASSLSQYPFITSDIDGSEGSTDQFLKTDGTQSGVTWDTPNTSGIWDDIATKSDSDATNRVNITFTPSTTYDIYRMDMYYENYSGVTDWLDIVLENDGSSVYAYTYIDANEGVVGQGPTKNQFRKILSTYDNHWAFGTYELLMPDTSSQYGSPASAHPTISRVSTGQPYDASQLLTGQYTKDPGGHVSDINIHTNADGAATVTLRGRNL